MASLFDAINAAAAALNNQNESKESAQGASVKPRVQPKSAKSGNEERRMKNEESSPKVKPKQPTKPTNPTEGAEPKAQPKTDSRPTPDPSRNGGEKKTKGGASYVIPKEFKQAIETYLNGRADMKAKLSAKGKSIDGCCDYIFDVMRKRAEKQRGGKSAVGLYAPPDEIFGLAVHYYDETEESLKAELKNEK